MARPLKREIRPTEVRCIENGHRFTARVRQVGHTVEEGGGPQDIIWKVETTESANSAAAQANNTPATISAGK